MQNLLAAIALYEMINLRLKRDSTMKAKTQRKLALMAENKIFLKAGRTQKDYRTKPIFAFRALTTKIRDRRAG